MTRIKSRRWTTIGAALAAFVAVLGGVAALAEGASGGGGGGERPLIITAEVERRTLVDDVTLRGTVGRVEQRQVSGIDAGRVSAVHVDDGVTVEAGQPVLAIDGRDAIAVPGTFPFYRSLDVGDEGNDVLQLETVLRDAGYAPGPVDSSFTEATLSALGQWQADRGYPSTTPERDETFTISLTPGTGYSVGDESAGAVVIAQSAAKAGPTVKQVSSGGPLITIDAVDAIVNEGGGARFRIAVDRDTHAEWTLDLLVSGSAGGEDFVAPLPVTIGQDVRQVELVVPIRQDDDVEFDETLVIALVDEGGFDVSGPASVTIISDDVPELRLVGGGAVAEGGAAVLEIVADQPPVFNTQVALSLGGDAVAGDDYRSIDPVVVLRAGERRVEVPVVTLIDDTLEDTERIVVGIAAGSSQYRVGRTSSAIVTIDRAVGDAALPVVTLRTTASNVSEGQPIPLTVSLSRAIVDDLILSVVYSGTAGLDTDYVPSPGRITVPRGQTSLSIQVPTVQDDVVEPDRSLTVTLAPSALYRIGSPDAASAVIESDDVPELRLEGGIVRLREGGNGGFTIVADQAPTEDVSISYQAVGSATPGQDLESLTGIVLLRAGQTSVTVPLTTLRDDVVFEPTDMLVGEWPIRIGQVLVDEGDSVQPGAALLSLTETDLTVTLRASATDRTKLEPGQTVTVKLSGGTTSAEGTISEVDETATIDQATGEQFYEGKVDVADLQAADGAAVTIEVVLDRRADALTVPIAAVLQDGAGDDIVRVIDLTDGSITEVPVTTGISEGSYIEVESGDLEDGDVVIVQVDRTSP